MFLIFILTGPYLLTYLGYKILFDPNKVHCRMQSALRNIQEKIIGKDII